MVDSDWQWAAHIFSSLAQIHSHLTLCAKVIIVPHQIIWSWYTGHWWVGCYTLYSEERTERGRSPAQAPLCCTKYNSTPINGQCTNHRIPVAYNGALLCGFNVPIKALSINFYDFFLISCTRTLFPLRRHCTCTVCKGRDLPCSVPSVGDYFYQQHCRVIIEYVALDIFLIILKV